MRYANVDIVEIGTSYANVTIQEIVPVYADLASVSPTTSVVSIASAFQFEIPAFQTDAFQIFEFNDPAMANVSIQEL